VLELAKRRIDALQKLLSCYRVGKRPSEKLLDELDVTESLWSALVMDRSGNDPDVHKV
jgi:hypothetical protein